MKTTALSAAILLLLFCSVDAVVHPGDVDAQHSDTKEKEESWGQNTDGKQDIVTKDELNEALHELKELRSQVAQNSHTISEHDKILEHYNQAFDGLKDDIRHGNNTHHIAFTVGLTQDFGPVTVPTTIPFDKVLFDVGGGWNDVVHSFIAPVDGVYFFAATILSTSAYDARCVIYHTNLDSGDEGLVAMFGGSSFIGQANHVTIRLLQGDGMSVKLSDGNFRVDGHTELIHTTMSGFYLFP